MSEEEQGAASAAEESVESGKPSEETVEKGDYLGRVGSDPEFAKGEIQNKDRHITELQNKLKGYEPIEKFVDAVGADSLVGPLEAGWTLQQHPQLVEVLKESIRTGKTPVFQDDTPPPTPDEDDTYMDPDYVRLDQKVEQRFSALMDKVENIEKSSEQRFAQAETRTFSRGVEKNVDAVLKEWGVNSEIQDELRQAIAAETAAAQTKAQNGDKRALSLLEQLSGPTGIKTLKMLAMPVYENHVIEIGRHKEQAAVAPVVRRDTGVTSEARAEPQDKQTAQAFQNADTVRQALRKNTKAAGADPDSFWSQ